MKNKTLLIISLLLLLIVGSWGAFFYYIKTEQKTIDKGSIEKEISYKEKEKEPEVYQQEEENACEVSFTLPEEEEAPSVSGQVYCQDDGGTLYPMNNVAVTIYNDTNKSTQEIYTDANGYYSYETSIPSVLAFRLYQNSLTGSLTNGKSYSELNFPPDAVYCAENLATGCYEPGCGEANASYENCYLAENGAYDNFDFRFTDCSKSETPTPPPNDYDLITCWDKYIYLDEEENYSGNYYESYWNGYIANGADVRPGTVLVFRLVSDFYYDLAPGSYVTMTDTLDEDLEFLDGESGVSYNSDLHQVTCTFSGLTGSEYITYLDCGFRVKVKDNADEQRLNNTYDLTHYSSVQTYTTSCSAYADIVRDPEPSYASCSEKLAYKDVDSNSPGKYNTDDENRIREDEEIQAGTTFVYHVKGHMLTTESAGEIVWTDYLDGDLEFVDGEDCVSYDSSEHKVTCNMGDDNRVYNFAFRVRVKNNAPSQTLSNVATVRTDGGNESSCRLDLKINQEPTPPEKPELPIAGGLPPTLIFTLGGIVLVVLGLLF